MKIVITGPPSSGKTTIIKILKKIGFPVISEAARDVILSRKNLGLAVNENSIDLQLEILKQQIERENSIRNVPSPIFFDRGIPDVLSYLNILGGSQDWIPRTSLKCRYEWVFFLERLQIEDDGLRETSPVKIQKLAQALRCSYEDLGYKLVRIPSFSDFDKPTSTALRLNLIFERILKAR